MKGLIPRITEQIFASIMSSPANLEYLVSPVGFADVSYIASHCSLQVKVSFFEVYMERIRDLLARELLV